MCGYVLACWKQQQTQVTTEGPASNLGCCWGECWISESHCVKGNGNCGGGVFVCGGLGGGGWGRAKAVTFGDHFQITER